jgi:hypothetical protein
MQADGTLSFLEGHLAIAVRRKLGHVLDSLETDTKTALVGSSNTANFARIWHNFAATCVTEKKHQTRWRRGGIRTHVA